MAISINLSQILKVPGLIPRAIEVLILLTAVLVLSTLLLMPSQNAGTLAAEVLSITVLAEAFVTSIHIRAARHLGNITTLQFASRVFGAQVGLVFLLVGAVSLLAQAGGGLYWVVPGMLAAMVAAIVGAWVLLVEIVR